MLKELKYGGYSASPNDHDSLEGDLAVAMNLIPEQGTVRPVLPPSQVFTVPQGYNVMCIHETSAFRHYVLWNEDTHTLSYMKKQGDTYTATTITLDATLSGVVKVEPIGNTLVILTEDGLHYILWKGNNYNYLGSHLPELNMNFRLGNIDLNRINYAETQIVDISDKSGDYAKACTDDVLSANIRQAIMAVANEQMAYNCKAGGFTFPFFVRYCYRLYDGTSLTMHSTPIYMAPNTATPTISVHKDDNDIKFSSGDNWVPKALFYDISSQDKEKMLRWKDIIASIDVFVSPQFYLYDQAAKSTDIKIRTTFDNNDNATVTLPVNKKLHDQVSSNGTFFLISSIQLEKLNTEPLDPSVLVRSDKYGKFSFDFEISNENIVTRELMTDDYYSHDTVIPSNSFAYNSRINISGITKRLFDGFWPGLFFHIRNASQPYFCKCTVVIEQDGKQVIVRSPLGYLEMASDGKFAWFFYPNPNAKTLYVEHAVSQADFEGGATETFFVKLKQHPALNGAYFYGLAEDSEIVDGSDITKEAVLAPPEPSADKTISQPNKVYTSEVNNPFYFPLEGINSISSGRILGLCAAVRPVSTSQFGYADLYIFADNGVWVAKINEKGTYSNIDLATGDICINPDSITQMETTVLFATARGIMLLSGSQAQCISEAIDDDGQQAPGLSDITGLLAPLLGLSVNIKPFREFLPGCRMAYDYRGQRIIAFNPSAAFPYAYIYSLESNKWGMMQSDISYTVKDYPQAMAVTHDGHLVNYSEPVEVLQASGLYGAQLLVTRPLTLDQPDVLKTVTTVLQRGLFAKRQGHVRAVLYGSRDLYNWHMVMSSTDENMRGRRGTPYKWFRVALLLRLPAGESVTGCSIQFDTKYTNRLR